MLSSVLRPYLPKSHSQRGPVPFPVYLVYKRSTATHQCSCSKRVATGRQTAQHSCRSQAWPALLRRLLKIAAVSRLLLLAQGQGCLRQARGGGARDTRGRLAAAPITLHRVRGQHHTQLQATTCDIKQEGHIMAHLSPTWDWGGKPFARAHNILEPMQRSDKLWGRGQPSHL